MNALDRLKGQKVIALIDGLEFKGTVMDYEINDFYFHEKNEPIQITISVMLHNDYNEEDDDDSDMRSDMGYVMEVPLSNIRKLRR